MLPTSLVRLHLPRRGLAAIRQPASNNVPTWLICGPDDALGRQIAAVYEKVQVQRFDASPSRLRKPASL